jgi:NitT/TauT family transport system substrate-binding protein
MYIAKAAITALAVVLFACAPAHALDKLTLAIGQPGLWDSSFADIGQKIGIFKKHGLELQTFYTSGGGETQQAVIAGSAKIGVSPGTLGVFGAFAKGAPIRIIAAEATGTAEYYFVKSASPIKSPKDFTAATTLAYSTAGSGTFLTAQRMLKQHNVQARLVATGNVPATYTSVMSGQVDVGFSTPPFGLEAHDKGEIRIIALANDLDSVRTQTVRVTIANALDFAKRPDVYKRFIAAYREAIDWMYSDPKAPDMFAQFAKITPQMAQTVRDRFYPKSMLQLDKVYGIPEMMQDAIALKFIPQPLTQAQLDELLKLPGSY